MNNTKTFIFIFFLSLIFSLVTINAMGNTPDPKIIQNTKSFVLVECDHNPQFSLPLVEIIKKDGKTYYLYLKL
jgi:hypothetical protein